MFKDTKFGPAKVGAEPVRDVAIRARINALSLLHVHAIAGTATFLNEFTAAYDAWIKASTLNDLGDLSGYQRYSTLAVTHVLEQFLLQHRVRRFRILRGEYPGTRLLLEQNKLHWAWLEEDSTFGPADALVLSVPFSGSGNLHERTFALLEQAQAAKIPVLIDCAFYGICRDVRINLADFDVESIAFSLSKPFNVPALRVGMLYSKNPPPSIALLHSREYVGKVGMGVVYSLFEEFSSDYLQLKYRATQERICAELGLTPSNSVLFGLGDGGAEWQQFSKDGAFQRVSFGAFLPQQWAAQNAN